MGERFTIKIERTSTQDRKRVQFICTNRQGTIRLVKGGSDQYTWKKFPAGKTRIYVESWWESNTGNLVLGKVIEDEQW